jgi:hypothetical protein
MSVLDKIDNYLNEQNEPLFTDKESAEKIADYLKKNIKAPVIKASISKIGPQPSIMLKISLDERKDWKNGIFENSRFLNISIEPDTYKSNLEVFNKSHKIDAKFRKQKGKSKEEIVKKLNNYIKKIK